MRILLCAVGRMRDGPEKALFGRYQGRIPWRFDVIEVEEKRRLAPDDLKRREADLLLGKLPPAAAVVALDETGRTLSSDDFADRLGRWRDSGVRDVAFLIGGAEGLDAAIRDRADLVLSLGPMTWPHMLVRTLLAEQLYRAHAILSGHPYHRSAG